MVGLKRKEISKEILLIFAICYEYSLNFTNVLKLFKISRRYFWTFLEICNPMLKMGARKAVNIRKSVERILPYAQSLYTGVTEDLTPHEDSILKAFEWFVQDSFSDGESCLHISQLSAMPFIKGYRKDGSLVSAEARVLEKNLDEVNYIKIGKDLYPKTSRMMYYLEKYAGDLNIREMEVMSVKDMLKKVNMGIDEYAKQQ